MQVIGCGDDNCIGKFRDIEYFFPIAETVLIGDTIQILHILLTLCIDVGYTYDFQRVRIMFRVTGICSSTGSGSNHNRCNRFINHSLLTFQIGREFVG